MVYIENKVGVDNVGNVSYIYLLLSGFLMSIGVVVPGVSNTIILMLLGVYSMYLNSVSTLYLPVLIPMAMGLILGSLVFMKIIKYLLDNFYIQTMLLIIGFTLGSVFVLLPDTNSMIEIFLCFLWGICGYYIINMINV